MSEHINSLRAKIAAKRAELNALDIVAGDKPFTEEQQKQWDTATAEGKALARRLAGVEDHEIEMLASAKPLAPGATTHENREDAPWGETPARAFANQMRAVRQAEPRISPTVDPRLRKLATAAPSGSNEGIGSEGGFALAPAVNQEIERILFDSAELFQRCMAVEVGPDNNEATVTVIDETSRVKGSRFGGIQVYHAAEAATVAASKPKVRKVGVRLEKIMGLWYVTDEEMEDSTYLASVGPQAFGEEIAFQVDEDIFDGTGAGMAQGIARCPALVTVAKEAGQEAASIYPENINKMWARVPARSQQRGVWLINPDCSPALDNLNVGIGAGGQLVYMPPGGLSEKPYGNLKGRPVIPNEHSKTLGAVGDIMFADLGWYAAVRKGEIKSASSIHVRFIYEETAFRFTYRFNGLPVLSSAITPAQGSATVSPFVALAIRA